MKKAPDQTLKISIPKCHAIAQYVPLSETYAEHGCCLRSRATVVLEGQFKDECKVLRQTTLGSHLKLTAIVKESAVAAFRERVIELGFTVEEDKAAMQASAPDLIGRIGEILGYDK